MVHHPQDGEGQLTKRDLAASDTIAAQATPRGMGGVGIIRVSGPAAPEIARAILGRIPEPRQADYLPFRDEDGGVLDTGIALFFPSPHSFTGEDVLELQGHGGPVVMDLLLQRVVALGARLARPGEFSERAFLNGKLDLAQAEAIADLISSATEQAARSALSSLQGEFSRRVRELVEQVIGLRTHVEASIDFSEEEIDFLADERLAEWIDRIVEQLQSLLASSRQGCLLREGIRLVIAGRPNAGKSSLLNALARRESAIVTDIPGTTRDVVREQIAVAGVPLHIIDTAGLRESSDPVEQEGIRRAWEAIENADHLLLVIDDDADTDEGPPRFMERIPAGIPITVVRNKIDRSGATPAVTEGRLGKEIWLSALTGEGIELLRQHLIHCIGLQNTGEGAFMARRRHLEALNRALAHLEEGRAQLRQRAGELLAEELRQVQHALGEITGEFCNEDLLDRIFSGFCIGK